jgi:hypothetical protein
LDPEVIELKKALVKNGYSIDLAERIVKWYCSFQP